ncbi:MAG: protoporphyrinogen oxidase HemJ [Hyphomicrobiales bacterium]
MQWIAENYSIIKAIHIISVISWMAGLLYLPRLFVNHANNIDNAQVSEVFRPMERKLLKYIMNPAMILTWTFGLLLASMPGLIDFKTDMWFHIKFLAVIFMTIYHMYLGNQRKKFITGEGIKSAKFYKLINEIPTILMIIIVVMVVVRPFN